MLKNYITCFILITFILHLESKIIVKSSNTFPHRSNENYIIKFKTLPVHTRLLITILDGHKIVEQNEINKKVKEIKKTTYFEYIKLNFKNNTVILKFKQNCDTRKLVIYEKSKVSNYETRIYRKLVDLIILANLTFTTRDVIVKEKRFIEYKCTAKPGNYLSIPIINNLNNITVISKNSSINPNEKSVVLLVNEKDDGYNIECSDASGAKTNITIRYDGHPNEVDILPKYKYNLSLNTSLECVAYPDEIDASLNISWTVKTWDNKIFEYSNNSLDLDQVNKLSKCNHFTVTCHVQSNISRIIKLLSKQIQFTITYSNEEIDQRMYFTMKEMCEMKIRLKHLEIQNKIYKDTLGTIFEYSPLLNLAISKKSYKFQVDNFKQKALSIENMKEIILYTNETYLLGCNVRISLTLKRVDYYHWIRYQLFFSYIIIPGRFDLFLKSPCKMSCKLKSKNKTRRIQIKSTSNEETVELVTRESIYDYESYYLQNGSLIMEVNCQE